jgi:Crp-like helix-turn-helix domain
LARALLLLSRAGKEAKTETVIPQVSRETLAEMVGTTRSRVKFFMNKFRKLDFIDYDGGLEMLASQRCPARYATLRDWTPIGILQVVTCFAEGRPHEGSQEGRSEAVR